jgi:antitoxin HicB
VDHTAHQAETTVYDVTAVFEPDLEDGGYVVTFPAFPDLATQGETMEEARAMAAECLELYLEHLRDHGLPLPQGGEPSPTAIREQIRVELKSE